jgi:hypothetical protein
MNSTRLVRVLAGAVALASAFGCSSGSGDAPASGGQGGGSGNGGAAGSGGSSGGNGGTSGASGDGGTSGAAGNGGTSGASGNGGTSGAAGNGGTSGASGTNGASGGTSGASGAGGTSGSTGSGTSFDGTRIRARITARQVGPGGENHVCVVLELPNPDQVWIGNITAMLTGGSHHLIVDRRPAGTSTQPEPQVCAPTMGGNDSRLVIAQQAQTTVALPSGVAFKMEARQPLFLQLHYFNAGNDVRDISGEVEFVLANTTGGAPIEAKSLFTGTLSIDLAPMSPGASEGFFVPRPESGTRHVFALTSHTHKLGVKATIERVASATSPVTTPIHESLDWSEPPLTQFSPPLLFSGTDGLRLKCNYNNTTTQRVGFGTGVDQEMCFMWVYYYDR